MRWWQRSHGATEDIWSLVGCPLASAIRRNHSSAAPGRRAQGQSLQSPAHHKPKPWFPSAKVRWLHCLPIPEPVFIAAYLKLGNPQELLFESNPHGDCFHGGTLRLVAALFSSCLLAVGVCWNQNWRKALGIHPGNKRAFVQEDLEDSAASIAATCISVPPCQNAPAVMLEVGCCLCRGMDRQEDGHFQRQKDEVLPKCSCIMVCKAFHSFSAKPCAPCPGFVPCIGWALLLSAAAAPSYISQGCHAGGCFHGVMQPCG